MNVTIVKTKNPNSVVYEDLKAGTVFRFVPNKCLALRLTNGHVLFQCFGSDEASDVPPQYYDGHSIKRSEVSVVGKLSGLEVETNG